MREINKKIVRDTIEHYGAEMQLIVCMEECAELTQAISKVLRQESVYDNIIEEVADVEICLENIKQIFGISEIEIDREIHKKQRRIINRMIGDKDE